MGTMRFMSCPSAVSGLPKVFSFDSSPGRAIAQALGSGVWDEHSYRSELMEDRAGDKIYAIYMRRLSTDTAPGPHLEQKVGMITHTPAL